MHREGLILLLIPAPFLAWAASRRCLLKLSSPRWSTYTKLHLLDPT